MLPERKQVLIVDDEPNLRKILSAQLTRDGYDVLTAEDGEQGLAALKEHHIDLVITDLKMPKVDGMTLLRRALQEEPELPIILITAHGISHKERARLHDAGKKVIDTTCPLVTRAHDAAQKLQADGCHVLVIGKRGRSQHDTCIVNENIDVAASRRCRADILF